MAGPAGASCPHGAGSVRSAPFRPYPGAPRRARRNRPQRRCRKGGGGQAAPAPAVWLPLEALRGLAGPGRDADGAIRAVGAGGSEAPELRREPAAGAGGRRGDGGAVGEADGGRGAEGGGTTVRRGRGGSAGGGRSGCGRRRPPRRRGQFSLVFADVGGGSEASPGSR